jgi:hypothetical protein
VFSELFSAVLEELSLPALDFKDVLHAKISGEGLL